MQAIGNNQTMQHDPLKNNIGVITSTAFRIFIFDADGKQALSSPALSDTDIQHLLTIAKRAELPLKLPAPIVHTDLPTHLPFYAVYPLVNHHGKNCGTAIILQNDSTAQQILEAAWLADEKLKIITDTIPQLVWIKDASYNTLYINIRWTEFTGCSLEKMSSMQWYSHLWPADVKKTQLKWTMAVERGSDFEAEYRLRKYDGSYEWFVSRGVPVKGTDGSVIFWFGTCTNVDSQKRSEEMQRIYANISEQIRNTTHPYDILRQILRTIAEWLDISTCVFTMVDAENDTISSLHYHTRLDTFILGAYEQEIFGKISDMLKKGIPVTIVDIKNDPLTKDAYNEIYAPRHIESGIFIPIIWQGKHTATLAVYESSGSRHWSTFEIDTVQTIAERAWLAYENARLSDIAAEVEKARQKFLVEILNNVTDGKFRLCIHENDMPKMLTNFVASIKMETDESLKEMRNHIEQICNSLEFPDERKYDLLTAAGEAAMNTIVHAKWGIVSIYNNNQEIMVKIEDLGPGIELERIPKATLARGYTTAGTFGHGFKLMLKMIDKLWLLTRAAGTTIILEQMKTEQDPEWLSAIINK